MKHISWLCLFLAISTLTSFSCRKDSNGPSEISYASGVLITNRGALFDPVGSISHYNRETGAFSNKIYQRINADTLFGSIQSITAHQGRAYIVMNDPDRIEVVNLRDFVWEETIDGLTDPKHVHAASTNKLYISQWGADGLSGSIQVYNLTNGLFLDSIPTGRGPGPMVQVGNTVYVANSGGILSDSTLAVINTSSDSVIDHIDVGTNPTHLVVDKNNAVWSLSKGIIFQNPPNVDGKLSKIVNNQVVFQQNATAGAANLAIDGDKDFLYYVMDGWTYSHDINATTFNTTPFLQKYYWGIGVDPETDHLWGTDPKNFFVPGDIFIHDKSGEEVDVFSGDIVPEKFLFQ